MGIYIHDIIYATLYLWAHVYSCVHFCAGNVFSSVLLLFVFVDVVSGGGGGGAAAAAAAAAAAVHGSRKMHLHGNELC